MVTVSGLTGTHHIGSVKAWVAINGIGKAEILIYDLEGANQTNQQQQIGNVITIADDTYSTVWFKGEVLHWSRINRHLTKLMCGSGARKVYKQPSNVITHPVFEGTVRALRDNLIVNEVDSEYGGTGWADKFVTLKQNNTKTRAFYPESVTATVTPDTTRGEIDFLHFDNGDYTPPTATTNNEYQTVDNNHNSNNPYEVSYFFDIWLKEGSAVKDIRITTKYSIYRGASDTFSELPKMGVDNFAIGLVRIRTSTNSEAGDETAILESDTLLSQLSAGGDVSVFLDPIGGANSSDFTRNQLEITFSSGVVGSADTDLIIRVFSLRAEVYYDDDQSSAVGFGKIVSSFSDLQHIAFDVSAPPEYAMTDFPLSDGFAEGDSIIVTDNLFTQLPHMITQSSTGYSLTNNLTGASDTTFVYDYANDYLGDIFTKATNHLNGWWWYEPSDDSIQMTTRDNATQVVNPVGGAPIVIDETDIINGMDGYSHDVNGDMLRSFIKMVGQGGAHTEAITPQYTLDGGVATAVEVDNSLKSLYWITQAASKNAYKYTNAQLEVGLEIDLALQSNAFDNLKLGLLIDIKLPVATGSRLNMLETSGNGLLVAGAKLESSARTGFRDWLGLTLQKRSA